MFNLLHFSKTAACSLLHNTLVISAVFVFLKNLMMFSAFVPEPEAKITIRFITVFLSAQKKE